MFEAHERSISTPALTLRYHLNPWDEPSLGARTATIAALEVHDETSAVREFDAFRAWCDDERVALVTCRLSQERLAECGFLERFGFRFIELNYRPELAGLGSLSVRGDEDYLVETASPDDAEAIAAIAGEIFEAGRFHIDPLIDPRVGDRRYRQWASNAFRNPGQTVWKCGNEGRIDAFFVIESPSDESRFWSLVGLAPGLSGKGLGTRIWRAVLYRHQREGVGRVSTSISSLNVPVFNLYVKLGFRFPPPTITLHWCPRGRIEGSRG